MQTLLAFAGALAVVYAIPGPDMVLVLDTSSKRGFGPAFVTSLGLAGARVCQVFFAAVGLAGLLRATPWLFDLVRVCGALYLIWLGVRIFRNKASGLHGDDGAQALRGSKVGTFGIGFMTNILNPKALLFCSLFLPQFITPAHGAIWLQFLYLGAILVGVGFAFDLAFAAFGAAISTWLAHSPMAGHLQRYLFSLVIAGFGVHLLLVHL